MLNHLQIKNFIIIPELDIDFKEGLTVITGETGSGKSIIIDALTILLGGKTDSSIVGKNENKCNLSACFNLTNTPKALQWLSEKDFETAQAEECLIRRIIGKDGKSRQMINGIQCTLQELREFASLLIHLHSQNQHQQLTKRQYQRELLDQFSCHLTLCEEVKSLYYEWVQNQNKITQLSETQKNAAIQLELLQYQITEFEKLNLLPSEYERLDAEHKQLANREQLIKNCHSALAKLAEDDRSAQCFLYQAQSQLSAMVHFHEKLQSSSDLLNHAIIHVEETVNELQDYLSAIESYPERLAEIETRLSTIHQLARKYSTSPRDLPLIHNKLIEESENLQQSEAMLATLNEEATILANQYSAVAKKLTDSRKQAALTLTNKISEKMRSLGMPGGIFEAKLSHKEQFSPYGLEEIEYLVSMNPGQAPQPLSKIASGGELSRIALAIYVITAEKNITPILVFDEVDVGIGGGTAAIVGNLLKSISQTAQVLCITHLPQVAACGNLHLLVKKQIAQNETHTTIIQLTASDKIQEIARMLGGLSITENSLAHAEELIATS